MIQKTLLLFYALLLTYQLKATEKRGETLNFIENVGQVTDQFYKARTDIDFKLTAPDGLDVYVGNNQVHYQWQKPQKSLSTSTKNTDRMGVTEPVIVDLYRMDVTLVGSNSNATVVREEKQAGYDIFYNDHTNGATAYSYQKITYKNVYNHIDWVLYVSNNSLKYDFVVHPGGNPADIKLKFEGATDLSLNDGGITASTPMGTIAEKAPYTYEAETGRKIASDFLLTGNILSFQTGHSNKTLVIDPAIAWSTYYGGNNTDYSKDIEIDKSGNIYIGGYTNSTSNMATTGAFQTMASSGKDGFITKFSTAGQRIWGTYFGGTGDEIIQSLAIDKDGNLYVAGDCANTTAITSTGAHQTIYGGGTWDAFLAKLTPGGQRLWGTFYGGTGEDRGTSIACDTNNCVYLTGWTESTMYISTPGSHQPSAVPGTHGYLAKFYSNGQRHWGTYYGGNSGTFSYSVQCSADNQVYMTGSTVSTTNIATPLAYQGVRSAGGFSDAFYVKFDTTGVRLYATYYGGTSGDGPVKITTDAVGNIYLAGITHSTDTIATPTSFQNAPSLYGDGFIAKFNINNQKLWGTYYGGDGIESLENISCDAAGNVYIFGTTSSLTNMASVNAYRGATAIGYMDDVFFAVFNPSGQRDYGSYFGGEKGDGGTGVCDASGNIYLTGGTASTTGVITPGCYQPTLQSFSDAFITKFGPDNFVVITAAATALCPNVTFNVNYTVTGAFQAGNIFKVVLSDANGVFNNPVTIGSIVANTTGTIPCTIPASTPAGTGYRVRIEADNPYYVSADNGNNIAIQYVLPSVTITANPASSAGPGRSVTFTATVTNGGATPTYQWKKNSVAITGATNAVYTGILATDFNSTDAITVDIVSNYSCANPTTASSNPTYITINTGVGSNSINDNSIQLYPNPVKNSITLTGCRENQKYTYTILNSIGARLQQGEITKNHTIELNNSIPNGLYHISIEGDNTVQHIMFVVHK